MDVAVSVIISAYNKYNCVKRVICSVLQQSFGNLEVIVVDDGSIDGTVDVVEQMMTLDKRLRLVKHEKNIGLSQTRLTGLSEAKGDYIMFLDADDTIERDAVKKLLSRVEEASADIVVMGSRRVSNHFPVKIPFFIPSRFFGDRVVVSARDILPTILSKSGFSLSIVDKMYRRSLLLQAGLKAEKEFMGEDMLFNMRVFNRDARVAWTDYVGYNWTTGGGSEKFPAEMWDVDKRLYNRCCEVLQEINADNVENKTYLAQGIADAFVYEIARSMVNPFFSRTRVKKWIAEQLSHPIWNDVKPLLGNKYSAIVDNDVMAMFAMGNQQLSRHRLFYTVLALI